MGVNELRQFLVYGAVLETGLDLSDYLVEGNSGRYSLELTERSGSTPLPTLEVCTPVVSSHGRDLFIFSDREFTRSEEGQPWCFEVSDVVRFCWVSGQGGIEYEALDQCTDQLLAFWLIHIFLPLYFTIEGLYEFIHACAVEVAGDSILFVAPSTGGKSTLTDFFLKQGHTLISDDKVATYLEDGTYFAVPSHPNHRPYRKFEELGYRVEGFSAWARPVDAFYALQAVDPKAEVTISEISGHQKFARLLPNYLFNFSFLKRQRLKYLAEMVSIVPLYRVEVPWQLGRLSEVHEAICGHRKDIFNR
jgi:hypothetical protein